MQGEASEKGGDTEGGDQRGPSQSQPTASPPSSQRYGLEKLLNLDHYRFQIRHFKI